MDIIEPKGFEWDEGNLFKNVSKHDVANSESEQVFFHFHIMVDDHTHSKGEKRYWLLGRTDDNTILFVVFTLRDRKIRVISSRVANKKERKIYNEVSKNEKDS